MAISDFSKMIGHKRRWQAYKARVRQLPPNYRTAIEAIERHLMYVAPVDGDNAASMFEVLAGLFEKATADGTPIREIIGEDPADFVETFAQNYSERGYVPRRVRKRLTHAIDRAARN